MENLTKQQVIDSCSNANLAEALGLEYVETTIERNGYPNSLKHVMISDSIDELNETSDYLEKLGFEVSKYKLHKKDGWGLWYRENENFFEKGQFMQVDDSDYWFDYSPTWSEEEAKKELRKNVCDNDEIINILYDEMKSATKDTRFFLDGVNDYAIEYSVSEDLACYGYDTNHYQLAIMVENFNIED